MNNPVYLGLSILDLSKSVTCKFQNDYVTPKFSENAKSFFMWTDSFILNVKAKDVYKYTAKDVETRFDTSNLELRRPFPKAKNEKLIGLIKDEFGGEIMKDFFGFRAKIFSYFKDNNNEDKKKKKRLKKVCQKRKL